MVSAFTDKTLQIAVQLGYFTFTEEMYGKTLGELMTKPDVVHQTSPRTAVYELIGMRENNLFDYDSYRQYFNDARELLAYQLEIGGVNFQISQDVSDLILSGFTTGFRTYQVWENLEEIGVILDEDKKDLLYLPDPIALINGVNSNASIENAMSAIINLETNNELYPDFYQNYISLSRFSLKTQLESLGINENLSQNYADRVLDERVFGLWDTEAAYLSKADYIKSILNGYCFSDEEIRGLSTFDPLFYEHSEAKEYLQDSYVILHRNIIKTRKLNAHSDDQDASRYNATMDLMNYLGDPDNYESSNPETQDNTCVAWKDIAGWKVVDIYDENEANGFYAVTFETQDGKMIVSFRGSESFDLNAIGTDWVQADALLAFIDPTVEQRKATEYMNYLFKEYGDREWYTTGHSLGGNLAEHALLTAPSGMNVVNAISFDGPGVSLQYLFEHSTEIIEKGDRLIRYQWSWVSNCLYPFEIPGSIFGENRYYIETRDYDDCFSLDYYQKDLTSFGFVHAPCFVDFDENGYVIPTIELNYISIGNFGVHMATELANLAWFCSGSTAVCGVDLVNDILNGDRKNQDVVYKNASRMIVNRDPLAIDFGAEGIELTSVDDGVYFDLDNNGFAEKTAWIGTEDGFLVLDRNTNGCIDNGGELFGDQVWLSNGYISVSGFDALKELDSNEDGIIDENDAAFSDLKVWVDASHDGISQDGELKTLAELGIQSISLEVTPDQSLDDKTGTLRSESAVVTYVDGTTTKISEFLFNVDTTDTVTGTGDDRKNTIGNIPDIMDAIENDESGVLGDLFNSFSEAINPIDKRAIFTKILYKITGAEDIDSSSRGANIDARNMHVVETFMGRSFMGVDGSEPNANAAVVLNQLYKDIENTCYLKLLMSTDFSDILSTVVEYSNDEGNKFLDLSVFNILSINSIMQNENIDTFLYDMSVFFGCYDGVNGTNYFSEYLESYGGLSDHYKSILSTLDNGYTVLGETNDDNLRGTSGNDILFAGAGDDYITGGTGNDAYYFELGDGNDLINDSEYSESEGRADKIVFGEGINPEDIIVDREGDHLRISYSDEDSILVQDAYNWYHRDGRNFVENIEFADGTVWDTDKINREAEVREGSNNNDTMWGYGAASGYTGNETLYGRGGNDTIYASDGNDILYGDEGNDNLYGQEGDDTIIGGIGNDYLEGGNGNDTYIFNLGDGRDTINDSQFSSTEGRADKIIFGEGISADDIRVNREGDHLKIRYSDDDTITVQDAYYWYSRDGRNQVELVEFKDDSLYRINYDSTTLDFVESLRVEPEVDEDDVEEGANEVEIDFMVSAAEELMDESSEEDTLIEDILVSESSIDTMVNLVIQDMSETTSENVGSSDDLFEESSSGEYDQLWVVNE